MTIYSKEKYLCIEKLVLVMVCFSNQCLSKLYFYLLCRLKEISSVSGCHDTPALYISYSRVPNFQVLKMLDCNIGDCISKFTFGQILASYHSKQVHFLTALHVRLEKAGGIWPLADITNVQKYLLVIFFLQIYQCSTCFRRFSAKKKVILFFGLPKIKILGILLQHT